MTALGPEAGANEVAHARALAQRRDARRPVNRRRGEVGATLDGRPHTLCLTLGSLAELEDAFGVDDLGALAARLSKGVSARDIAEVIAAGLRGAGTEATRESVERMRIEDGAAGFARLCSDLLDAAFGGPDGSSTDTLRPRERP